MEGEKIALSMGNGARLFIENRTFYGLTLQEDEAYMLPKHRTNLPTSGFYIRLNFSKFLPHSKSTLDKEFETCLVIPSATEMGTNEGEIIVDKIKSFGHELSSEIEDMMKELIKEFVGKLRKGKSHVAHPSLVPIFISLVAIVYSPEVEHVFSSIKNMLFINHRIL